MNALNNKHLLAKLAGLLCRHIEPIFQPDVRLTLTARTPGNDEADVLVSNDSLDELAALIERGKLRPEVVQL